MDEEVEDGYGGSNQKREPKSESTERRDGRAAKGGNGNRVRKEKADQIKSKTNTWSDVVKGLKIEEGLEIVNSEKSGNESETADSVRIFDSEMLNQLEAKRKKGQRKRHQHRDIKGAWKHRKAGKLTKRVEAREIERVEECERGMKPGSRSKEPKGQAEPQVELEGEC